MTERCGKWMQRAKAHCGRPLGHAAHCLTDRRDYEQTRYEDNRAHILAARKAYREANLERIRAREKLYRESERGQDSYRRRVESGRQAASVARSSRRRADERADNIDHRLETLLGGLIGPSTT